MSLKQVSDVQVTNILNAGWNGPLYSTAGTVRQAIQHCMRQAPGRPHQHTSMVDQELLGFVLNNPFPPAACKVGLEAIADHIRAQFPELGL